MRRIVLVMSAVLLCVVMASCAGTWLWWRAARARVPAEGVVFLDGVPLAYADIKFLPRGHGPGPPRFWAITDAHGRFQMVHGMGVGGALEKLGVKPGTYDVVFAKREFMKPEEIAAETERRIRRGPRRREPIPTGPETLPALYCDQSTTPITASVPRAGKRDFRFELTSSSVATNK